MNCGHTYLGMQLKRVLKILPIQLLLNLLACIGLGIVGILFLKDGVLSTDNQKYRIGVVGDTSESYLGIGISTLQSIDYSRYVIDLVDMTEEEARKEFLQGEIYAFARVPDGLVESIETGANDRLITFVTTQGQKGIGSMVASEIADVVSNILTRSQSAVYGMQSMLLEYGKEDVLMEATNQLNLILIDLALSRRKFCDVENLGIANGLSVEGYYFCSFLLIFLLLSGMNDSSLFTHKNRELPRLLAARNVGVLRQIISEYLAYVCLIVLCLLEIFFVLTIVLGNGLINFAEWENMGVEPLFGFMIKLLPVVFMFAALHFFLYELVPETISGILLQFICAIAMGYLSGFFYPAVFFPETLKRIGELLPTGVALRFTDSIMAGDISWMACLGMMLYLLVFLILSVLIRKNRIQRG